MTPLYIVLIFLLSHRSSASFPTDQTVHSFTANYSSTREQEGKYNKSKPRHELPGKKREHKQSRDTRTKKRFIQTFRTNYLEQYVQLSLTHQDHLLSFHLLCVRVSPKTPLQARFPDFKICPEPRFQKRYLRSKICTQNSEQLLWRPDSDT